MNLRKDNRDQLYSTNGTVSSDAGHSAPADEIGEKPAIRSALYDPPKSTIDRQATFDGKYISESDLIIQGKLSGEITCRGTLLIDPDAQVKAKVEAASATIFGTYEGDLVCSGKLTIGATARVRGSVKTAVLVIEEGATVRASIETLADGVGNEVDGRRKDGRPSSIPRITEIGSSLPVASAAQSVSSLS